MFARGHPRLAAEIPFLLSGENANAQDFVVPTAIDLFIRFEICSSRMTKLPFNRVLVQFLEINFTFSL